MRARPEPRRAAHCFRGIQIGGIDYCSLERVKVAWSDRYLIENSQIMVDIECSAVYYCNACLVAVLSRLYSVVVTVLAVLSGDKFSSRCYQDRHREVYHKGILRTYNDTITVLTDGEWLTPRKPGPCQATSPKAEASKKVCNKEMYLP